MTGPWANYDAELVSRFHKVFVESFRRNPIELHLETPLSSLAGPSEIDDFFDELEFEFSGDIPEDERRRMFSVGVCLAWAANNFVREKETSSTTDIPNPFHWRDEISGLQRGILLLSRIIGPILFFFGVQLTIRGNETLGGALSGVGMFIAVQMFWGIKSCYNWLEKRRSALLQRPGYRGLFWIFMLVAYAIDSITIGTVIEFLQGE